MKINTKILFHIQQRLPALVLSLALLVAISGCSKDSSNEQPISNDKVAVTLNLSADGPLHVGSKSASNQRMTLNQTASDASIGTRALTKATSTDETAVRDMWVLQYDMSTADGTLRSKKLIREIYQEGEQVYVRASLEPMKNCRIVVIANEPGTFSEINPAIGSSLADLNALTFTISSSMGNGIPLDDSEVLPMRAESDNITLEAGESTSVRLPLYRLVSKVLFTLDNRCSDDYPRLTITSVALNKVPTTGSYTRVTEATHASIRFPEASSRNFMNYTPITENVKHQAANLGASNPSPEIP